MRTECRLKGVLEEAKTGISHWVDIEWAIDRQSKHWAQTLSPYDTRRQSYSIIMEKWRDVCIKSNVSDTKLGAKSGGYMRAECTGIECYECYEGADGDYFAYVLQIVSENSFWIELSICSERYGTEKESETRLEKSAKYKFHIKTNKILQSLRETHTERQTNSE